MRFPPKPKITQRMIAAINNFNSLASDRGPIDIPKARAKPRQLEHIEAVSLMKWWRINHARMGLPEIALFAIPNGGARDEITASRLKQEGVTPGVYDYMLAIPRGRYHGMFLELKATDGRISSAQTQFGVFAASFDYYQTVQYGWQDAAKAILIYMGRENLWMGA